MIHQSEVAKRRVEVPTDGVAGAVMVQVATFDFPADFTAASDVLEISMLPAREQLLSLELISDIAGVNVATVKLMDGEFGDSVDQTRDVTGATIATGSIDEATVTATRTACLAVPRQNKNTGIGVTLSANVTAGDGTLTLVAHYAA